jgi:protein-tyrosine-phosphatase
MPIPLVAFAAGSAAVSVVSSILGGRARKKAAYENARALEAYAGEVLLQSGKTADLLMKDADDTEMIGELNAAIKMKDAINVNSAAVFNAMSYRGDAKAAREATASAMEIEELAGRRILGEQVARFGGSGVALAGSPMLVVNEQENIISKNIANIRRTGMIKSSRDLTQARLTEIEGVGQSRSILAEALMTRMYAKLEGGRLRSQSDLERSAGKTEANRIMSQAGLERTSGRRAQTLGYIGAGVGLAQDVFSYKMATTKV